MGRGKLSMKLISNEKSRKTTFGKRKTSLMKKARELSILCDVRTCVFVYGSNHNDQSPVEVWPPSRDEVNNLIASYKANCLHKRARKAFDLLDFFSERKKKIEGDMSKLRKDVAETRFPKWDERLDYLLEDQLQHLIVELDLKLDATKRRLEVLMENNLEEGTSAWSNQTLNSNMKQKQVMLFDQEQNYSIFGSSSSSTIMETQTQAIMPFHHHHHHHHQYHQIQTMAQNLQMVSNSVVPHDHHHQLENLSQYIFGSNGYSQFQFNHGNCFHQNPNLYIDPTNGMIMENTQQNYSLCHYEEVPPLAVALPYMQMQQLTADHDHQIAMMARASSNSQMELPNNASAQLSDQFDYFNYEYFMRAANNF